MPTLDTLIASPVVKLLQIGDSGTGKTGALAALTEAGYDVRLLDFDNGWESLAAAVKRRCPNRLSSIEVESCRDEYQFVPGKGPVLKGSPQAFIKGIGLLDKWSDGSKPSDWGPGRVLCLDSLTFFADAAYNWADALNPSAKDKRQIYGAAQEAVEKVLALLTSASFNTNVIVNAHIRYIDLPDGTKRGYPTAVGSALSPTIPRYFNSVVQCLTQPGGKRTIQLVSTALIDLKNPKSLDIQEKSLPIETGLGDFFRHLTGRDKWTGQTSSESSPSQPTPTPASQPPKPATATPTVSTKPRSFSIGSKK